MKLQRVRLGPPRRFRYDSNHFADYTHYVFRYPAKFHPPIARALLEQYTEAGDKVLDPFCGSGTLLVEAAALGRHSVGIDVDPVAAFVSHVKTRRFAPRSLDIAASRLLRQLAVFRRSDAEYDRRMFQDIPLTRFCETIARERLWLPALPDPFHWFRRYVLIDLARIRKAIMAKGSHGEFRDFFLLCFASIIRGASNADPVPVSGLEVTSHMRKKAEEGRRIDPFGLFDRSVVKSLRAFQELHDARTARTRSVVRLADATNLTSSLRSQVDCLITSPPYHGAVDYYRRHTLEMYWLGFSRNQEDRLRLLPKYIGRSKVPRSHPFLQCAPTTPRIRSWEKWIREQDRERADAFRHYTVAMSRFLNGAAGVLPRKRNAILVVGRSSWNGIEIPTSQLFTELANSHFELVEHAWYPIKNRYMSYERRNGADINREHVLVYRRR